MTGAPRATTGTPLTNDPTSIGASAPRMLKVQPPRHKPFRPPALARRDGFPPRLIRPVLPAMTDGPSSMSPSAAQEALASTPPAICTAPCEWHAHRTPPPLLARTALQPTKAEARLSIFVGTGCGHLCVHAGNRKSRALPALCTPIPAVCDNVHAIPLCVSVCVCVHPSTPADSTDWAPWLAASCVAVRRSCQHAR